MNLMINTCLKEELMLYNVELVMGIQTYKKNHKANALE